MWLREGEAACSHLRESGSRGEALDAQLPFLLLLSAGLQPLGSSAARRALPEDVLTDTLQVPRGLLH